MKSILLVSIFGFLTYSCLSKGFISVSKQVEKECVSKSNWRGKTFGDLRQELYKKGVLNFVNSADSLYLLEGYDIESGTYGSKIWNTEGQITYTYDKAGFKFNQQDLFTIHEIQLIQEWDTSSILKEEKLTNVIHEHYLTGIMIVGMKKNDPQVYCIRFKAL